MKYFGPGGIRGPMHPSLRTYIDCFLSPPFPKMYPRGGGIWDQDPILVRHFRVIRNFEVEWKESQEQINEAKSRQGQSNGSIGGGTAGLSDALNGYIESLEY